MKNRYLFLLITILLISFANLVFCSDKPNNKLKFIENKGQWESNILYKTIFWGGYAFLENNGIMIVLSDNKGGCKHDINQEHGIECEDNKQIIHNHAFKLKLLNSNYPKTIIPQNKSKDYNNYYIGNDKSKWTSEAYSYGEISYKEIYNNIDWLVYSKEGNIKHDFIIHKGGKVEDISLTYEGIDKISLHNGNIILQTSIGEIVEVKPFAYQEINGQKKEIEAEFILKDKIITYKVKDYNPNYDLIIDPELIFSTYTGSTADNWGFTATYDKKGNVYIGGIASGTGYPTTIGAYDTTFNGNNWDISISKFDKLGQNLLYSTYIGGSSCEMPHSLIVNEYGELVIFGTTGSDNFPITDNAFQGVFRGGDSVAYDSNIKFRYGCDIFVCKFNSSGSELLASTFVGGSGNDGLNYRERYNRIPSIERFGNDSIYSNYGDGARGELITDDMNNIYVGSCTFSSDFPTSPNAFQPNSGGKEDGVVFKLDYSLSTMLFSSYIGGSEDDAVYSIDTDKEYKLYVAGGTVSHNFPTTSGAFSTSFNGGKTDGFLSLISYDGSNLLASTYFGSNQKDQAYFVRTDKDNNPHIFGQTYALGTSLVYNATYNIPNSGQFITKFTPDLQTRTWSTVFGDGRNRPNISPSAFAVDICGRIYVSGWGSFGNLTTVNMQTTSGTYDSITDGADFYIMSLASNASALDYATFFGENGNTDHVDGGTSRFDKFSTLYQTVCASCGGTDRFPTTPNAYCDSNYSHNCNAAAVKFNIHDDFPIADFDYPQIGCAPLTITFTNNSRGNSFLWDFGDEITSNDTNPTHTYTNGGIFQVTLIAYMANGCITSDTVTNTILVLNNSSQTIPSLITCPNVPIQIGIPPLSTNNITFQWHPSSLVTSPNISNPFAIITQPTNFYLIISNGTCSDTIWQRINIRELHINMPDTIKTCNSPYPLTIPIDQCSSYKFSTQRDFSVLINEDTTQSTTDIYLNNSLYIYIKVEKDGCIGFDSVWFSFSGTSLTVQTEDVKCNGGTNGRATAMISGGLSPHSFNWSNGQAGNITSINNLSVGDYSVIVTDSRGCQSTMPFTINEPNAINPNATQTNNPCEGAHLGTITINPSGGSYPYSILWADNSTSFSLSGLPSGDYIYVITDENNCTLKDTITIINTGNFNTAITKKDNNCIEACTGEAKANVSGGTEPYTYLWNNGETTQTITELCCNSYNVQTTDQNGCKSQASVTILNKDIFHDFWISASSTNIYDGDVILLSCTDITGVEYQWTPTTYVMTPNRPKTFATPMDTTTYYVYATDGNGCNYLDSIKINVEVILCNKPNIFIPNIFTPNGDGKNDVIKVTGEYIETLNLLIFDRWGEKVFSTTNPQEGWNGTYRGENCMSGVYYYRLEVGCKLGRKYQTSGDITLIR
ncbi:MAG: gliding motility-associated C-terminal domain-containing protein [Bacteroidales bacterium]|jgi:gliding motility-associated-like protein